MSRFDGKVALVTGAGSGIGEAVAQQLAAEGAKVVCTDINLEAVQKVVDAIKANGGDATAVQQDTAKAEDSERVVQLAVDTYGGLHLAVNNAGIGGAAEHTGEVAVKDWLQVIDINLNGVFYGCRYEIPAMLASGGGSIVNMGSIHSVVATPLGGNSAYVAAKHGVLGLTKNAAAEYAARGIRVNAVGPGYIDTPLLSALPAEAHQFLVTKHPINRLGHANEVAEVVTFLLSDAASNVTGGYLTVDGGFTAV
jgi:NAD(P)-dependent dehydrogenase (short-subunit alcohol dehydrogenase family)